MVRNDTFPRPENRLESASDFPEAVNVEVPGDSPSRGPLIYGAAVSKPKRGPYRVVIVLAAACSFGFRICGEPPPPSPAPGGAALYRRYCASCHGLTGHGDGPVAQTLSTSPADLTQLAKKAGGHLDESGLIAYIDGRRWVKAHGPREMPVWGAVFDEELKDQLYSQYTGLLQSRALADYIASIQEK
jgi:Cytochrome C oxidase, cbb3-type, subunit III